MRDRLMHTIAQANTVGSMPLTFYNSLTRRKDPFEPLVAGQVNIYCCGVTVYDYCHLGHARSYVVWDVLRRYLLWLGYRVRYVQNFTDIDDKILNRARKEKSTMEAVAERYIQAYFADMAQLNILEADDYPRATHTIDGIKRLIHELEQRGIAYPADGDVYYAVRQFPDYGKLSGRKLEEMQAGASGRVEADNTETARKRDPFDFVLWKGAKPGEPAWESPWGAGRPGWHIECSAMVRQSLGDRIDIHLGGADLVFPHHENEIAQSEAVTGKPLATYWLHNGMVNVGGEKMSKSLGNFTTIRQLLQSGVQPMVLRLFILQAQYRKPIDFTDAAIASAQNSWDTLQEGLHFGIHHGRALGWTDVDDSAFMDPAAMRVDPNSDSRHRFQTAMDDDLNTPAALVVLFELAKELRRQSNLIVHDGKPDHDPQSLRQTWQTLVVLAAVLGLQATIESPSPTTQGLTDAEIEAFVQQRQAARLAKNWAESDRVRDYLQTHGITLIDKPGGVTLWHR